MGNAEETSGAEEETETETETNETKARASAQKHLWHRGEAKVSRVQVQRAHIRSGHRRLEERRERTYPLRGIHAHAEPAQGLGVRSKQGSGVQGRGKHCRKVQSTGHQHGYLRQGRFHLSRTCQGSRGGSKRGRTEVLTFLWL